MLFTDCSLVDVKEDPLPPKMYEYRLANLVLFSTVYSSLVDVDEDPLPPETH